MAQEYCPDFAIVGFPKCGTTSLAALIATIDGVTCSSTKEPHYFTPEFPALHSTKTPEAYRALFGKSTTDKTFEASTWYAYSPDAVRRMLASNPAIKFVLCLRDPLRMAASYHQHLLRQGYEDVNDISMAWQLQEPRAEGRDLPKDGSRAETLCYDLRTAMGTHYQALVDIIPAAQLHVVFLEDLIENEATALTDLSAFLDIPDLAHCRFPRENGARVYRSNSPKHLQAAIAKAPWLNGVKQALKRVGVHTLYRKLVFRSVNTAKRAENPDFQAMFADHRTSQLELILKLARDSNRKAVEARAKTLLDA